MLLPCLQTNVIVTVAYKHPPSKLLSGCCCLFCLFTLSCACCRPRCAPALVQRTQPLTTSSV